MTSCCSFVVVVRRRRTTAAMRWCSCWRWGSCQYALSLSLSSFLSVDANADNLSACHCVYLRYGNCVLRCGVAFCFVLFCFWFRTLWIMDQVCCQPLGTCKSWRWTIVDGSSFRVSDNHGLYVGGGSCAIVYGRTWQRCPLPNAVVRSSNIA
jgi:hypothetical protein